MRIILAFLFLFLSVCIYAQQSAPKGDGVISGMVMDKGQGIPVEYANIAIYSQLDSTLINGTISNENGVFMISKIPYGKYYLEANFIGYKKVIIPNIEITKDNKFIKLEKIEIEQAVEMLEGAEIIEEKSYIEYKIDKKIVNDVLKKIECEI